MPPCSGSLGLTGPCAEAYYCRGGSTTATPQGSSVGGVCPPGAYCPAGTREPLLCPAGTFSNNTGNPNHASALPAFGKKDQLL